jgi:hypothetical protein
MLCALQAEAGIPPDSRVKVDGHFGPQTRNAFLSLDPNARLALANFFPDSPLEPSWVTMDFLDQFLRRAEEAFAIPSGTLEFFLGIEADRRDLGTDILYDAHSANGQYLGLFQIGRQAYLDVITGPVPEELAWLREVRFEKAVLDPRIAPFIAAGYASRNAYLLRKYGLPVTHESLYMLHNQGPGFVDMFLKKQPNVEHINSYLLGKQSLPAVKVAGTAIRQFYEATRRS